MSHVSVSPVFLRSLPILCQNMPCQLHILWKYIGKIDGLTNRSVLYLSFLRQCDEWKICLWHHVSCLTGWAASNKNTPSEHALKSLYNLTLKSEASSNTQIRHQLRMQSECNAWMDECYPYAIHSSMCEGLCAYDRFRLYPFTVSSKSRRPVWSEPGEAYRVACPAWGGLSGVVGPVWGNEIDSKVLCVCVCVEVKGVGDEVNLSELGQMLLTSSSQVDSLRGKMASNPPGVRASGLTHREPPLSTAPSSPFTHPLNSHIWQPSPDTAQSHILSSSSYYYDFIFSPPIFFQQCRFRPSHEPMWTLTD